MMKNITFFSLVVVINLNCIQYTLCPRSSYPFYIVSYYVKWVTTSWTYSMFVGRGIVQAWGWRASCFWWDGRGRQCLRVQLSSGPSIRKVQIPWPVHYTIQYLLLAIHIFSIFFITVHKLFFLKGQFTYFKLSYKGRPRNCLQLWNSENPKRGLLFRSLWPLRSILWFTVTRGSFWVWLRYSIKWAVAAKEIEKMKNA